MWSMCGHLTCDRPSSGPGHRCYGDFIMSHSWIHVLSVYAMILVPKYEINIMLT